MSGGTSHEAKAEPNLTPMLDMVFQLVTFFMLVINFKAAALDLSLKLPVVGTAHPVETGGTTDLLILNIDSKGNLNVYGRQMNIDSYIKGEAQASLLLARKDNKTIQVGDDLPATVVVRADRATPFKLLNRVIKTCQDNGFRKFALKAMNKETESVNRRKKKKRESGEIELNLAAMLDMAFQLLTFFILTFKPAPVEGQVALRLPPPQAIAVKNAPNAKQAGQDETDTSPVKGVNTLVITAFAKPDGALVSLAVGEAMLGVDKKLRALSDKLQTVFADPGNPFDQVIIQVSGDLRYDDLMRVVEVCTKQTLPDGQKLSKLSFVELPGAGDAGAGQ